MDQHLYSGVKDKASELRISVDFTTDLARFPILLLRQKAEVPEYLQGSDSSGTFWLDIGVWKFHERDCFHIDKFPTCTSSGLALQVLGGLNLC